MLHSNSHHMKSRYSQYRLHAGIQSRYNQHRFIFGYWFIEELKGKKLFITDIVILLFLYNLIVIAICNVWIEQRYFSVSNWTVSFISVAIYWLNSI